MKKLVIVSVLLLLVPAVFAQVQDAYSNTNPYYRVSQGYGGDPYKSSVPYYNNPTMNIRSLQRGVHAMPDRSPPTVQYAYGSTITQCGAFCNAYTRACYEAGKGDWECKREQTTCNAQCRVSGVNSCMQSCASSYATCLQYSPAKTCYAQFGSCQRVCRPEVQRPAPTQNQCKTNCDAAFNGCVDAGGSVQTCSQRVYNACMQECNPPQAQQATSAVAVKQGLIDEPDFRACNSCGALCGDQYVKCVQRGEGDCIESFKSCANACPTLKIVEPRAVPGPTARVVQAQPGFWSKMSSWFR